MEYIDIYNYKREKTGKTNVKGCKLTADEYILIAHVIVLNLKNEMLIQKRAGDKTDWPGYWDITAGGGAMVGEESSECAMREVYEELGITVDLCNVRPYFSVDYPIGFDDYYIVVNDINIEDIVLQKEEVTDVRWADKSEIEQLIKQNKFVNYKAGFIDLLFAFEKGRGTYDDKR